MGSVPMGNPHVSVLVTKSAFTYTLKKVPYGGPRLTSVADVFMEAFAGRGTVQMMTSIDANN
jgi:hypothetical protein